MTSRSRAKRAKSSVGTHVENALPARRPPRYSRWRAATLIGVYTLIGVHIAHWKLAGKTLAPLELNEVMYTFELGIVTAGFLLMATAALATVVFGRFFCSWGCHILALQDLCAWLLEKARIRPKPVRSRALLLVPGAALFYMFIWPQIVRVVDGRGLPVLHFAADKDGWASFATNDFWRNLPDPWIAGLTFLICGFMVVYALGSRAFCLYGCPYGAVFGLLDRVAPGRILLRGDCSNCGVCTAVCQSHVRVHEELQAFGTVVNAGCLKDLDCVAACPDGTLKYGFTTPPVLRSRFSFRRIWPRFDFTLSEETLMAAVFLLTLLAFRGLYDSIPFLLTLGLGGITAYGAVLTWRLFSRHDVRFNDFRLLRERRLTLSGMAFVCVAAAFACLTAQSVFIRYHEKASAETFAQLESAIAASGTVPSELLESAGSHVDLRRRFGLWDSSNLQLQWARVCELRGETEIARGTLADLVARHSRDLTARLALGRVLARSSQLAAAQSVLQQGLDQLGPFELGRADAIHYAAAANEILGVIAAERGDHAEARRAYLATLSAEPDSVGAHIGLGGLLANEGQLDQAASHLRRAVELRPESARCRYDLAVVLSASGRRDEALTELGTAARLDPDDADVQNNLGFLLLERGEPDSALSCLRRAVASDPKHAAAHFNLARALSARGPSPEAEEHMALAGRLDPTYARRPGSSLAPMPR